MTRRQLIQSLLGTVASYSLLETLFARDALAGPVKPAVGFWVRDLNEMTRDRDRLHLRRDRARSQGEAVGRRERRPDGAERVSGNLLRVRKLPVEQALRKYGHDDHHRDIQKTGLLRRGGADEPQATRLG